MVNIAEVNKDLMVIGEKHGVAYFSYDDIHNSSVQSQSHWDYKKVINDYAKAQKMSDREAEVALCKMNILQPLPNGEYSVDVGETTRNGGGLNYGGSLFFTARSQDIKVKYHELAHTLQKEYGLFSAKTIDEIYENQRANGATDDKLADKVDYVRYLNEMHSECFAACALLLRSKSPIDFFRQSSYLFNYNLQQSASGAIDFSQQEYNSEHSAKFYTTKPVLMEALKAVKILRKQKRTESFFTPDGVIDDKKLAKLSERIVLRKAYSPRVLQSYFNNNIADKYPDRRGWRRDALGSIVGGLATMPIFLLQERDLSSMIVNGIKHTVLLAKQKKQDEKFLNSDIAEKNPEMRALVTFEKTRVKLAQIREKSITAAYQLSPEKLIKYDIRDEELAYYAKNEGKNRKALEKDFKELAKIVNAEKKNPCFIKLATSDGILNSDIQKMIEEKRKNPQKEVTADVKTKATGETSKGYAAYPFKRQIEKTAAFCQKYGLKNSDEFKLTNILINEPQKFSDKKFRAEFLAAKIPQRDIFGIKKRKMAKDFADLSVVVEISSRSVAENPKSEKIGKILAIEYPQNVYQRVMDFYNQERENPQQFMAETRAQDYEKQVVGVDDKIAELRHYGQKEVENTAEHQQQRITQKDAVKISQPLINQAKQKDR